MSGPFAILRLEKIKSLRHLKARSDHNNRTDPRGVEHADPSRPPTLLAGRADAGEAWHERMASLGIDAAKLRPDAVLGIEFVASASPSFWATATDEQRTRWTHETMQFLGEQAGGADNILSAHLHDDETTPHIQLLAIPAVQKSMKKRGRPRKGQAPAEASAEPIWTLSARDLVGGTSHRLVELQDDYAQRMEAFGLRRGIPRKETGARNKAPSHWRAEQARLTDEARNITAKAVESRQKARKSNSELMDRAIEGARDLVGRAKKKAAEIEEAAQVALAAVEAREKQVEARAAAVERDAIIISTVRAEKGQPPIQEIETIAGRGKKRRQRPDEPR